MTEENDSTLTRDTAGDLVLVERMPEYLRGSHRAARNWGRWPHNRAERVIMGRETAQAECDSDPEYDHIVRTATDRDIERYERVREG